MSRTDDERLAYLRQTLNHRLRTGSPNVREQIIEGLETLVKRTQLSFYQHTFRRVTF